MPTSMPSYNLVDYPSKAVFQSFNSIGKAMKTDTSSFSFANFYYKGINVNGTCSAWNSYISKVINLPFDYLTFTSMTLAVQTDKFDGGAMTVTNGTCNDKIVVNDIITRLLSGQTYEGNCEGRTWRVYSCSGNTVVCYNCKRNCVPTVVCPGASNIISPCNAGCAAHVGAGSVLRFSYGMLRLYPAIPLLNVTSSTTSTVSLQANLSSPGYMRCAAIAPSVRSVSTYLISSAGNANFTLQGGWTTVTIKNLYPDTRYTVFCFTEDFRGHQMPVDEMLLTNISVSTTCCKKLYVSQTYPSIIQYFASSQAAELLFSFGLDSPPANKVVVSVVALAISCTAGTRISGSATISPTNFTFTRSDSTLLGSFFIRTSVAGCYRVQASSFNREYVGVNFTVNVRNFRAPPLVPNLKSGTLSNDGNSLLVEFDSATDQGASLVANYFGSFPCSQLVSFNGSNSCLCKWSSTSLLVAVGTVTTKLPLLVGAPLSLQTRVIRASCVANTDCSAYVYASAANATIQSAISPQLPEISLLAASSVSACDTIILDPTASLGYGGTNWVAIQWTVIEIKHNRNTSALSDYLNANVSSTDKVVSIPNSFLFPTAVYSITLRVTNVLNNNGIRTVQVAVQDQSSAQPQVRINGPSSTYYRWQSLILYAYASYPSCAGDYTNQSISYVWSVYDGITYLPAVQSASLDQRTFVANPYILDADKNYTFRVFTSVTLNSRKVSTASASFTVFVGRSGVTAVIKGGEFQTTNSQGVVQLDASSSYDIDYPSRAVTYLWTCFVYSPSHKDACPFKVGNSSKVVAVGTAGITYKLSVTVMNPQLLSSTTSVLLSAAVKPVPIVAVDTTIVKYNPSGKITLSGTITNSQTNNRTITAAWTCLTIPNFTTSAFPLTKTSTSFSKTVLTFPLVLNGDRFTDGISYTFQLQAYYSNGADTAGVSRLTITMNSPPNGGILSVSPPSGNALTTTFQLSTFLWNDDAADFPLYYSYSYYLQDPAQLLQLKTADAATNLDTFLGQGVAALQYRLTCLVFASDNLGATANRSATVISQPAVSFSASVQTTNTLIDQAVQNQNQQQFGQVFSAASTLLASTDCNVPTSCAMLNRYNCKSTARTCGACLPAFIGISGDANTNCISASSAAGIGSGCLQNSSCVTGFCKAGACVDVIKSCPGGCYGRGTCGYVDSSLNPISFCASTDPRCTALCSCRNGFNGADCSMTTSKWKQQADLIVGLCNGLQHSLKFQDVSVDVLISRSIVVSDLLVDTSRVTDDAYLFCSQVLLDSVNQNPDLICKSNAANHITSAISSMLAFKNTSSWNSVFVNASVALLTLSKSCQTTLVVGEAPLSIRTDNVRLVSLNADAQGLQQWQPLRSAQSSYETINGMAAAQISLDGGSLIGDSVGVSIIEYSNNPHSPRTNSSPIIVEGAVTSGASRRRLTTSDLAWNITLQNPNRISYPYLPSSNISLKCNYRLKDGYYLTTTCPNGRSVSVYCAPETKGIFNITCPGYTYHPVCTTWDGFTFAEDSRCTLVAFSETNTTCSCSIITAGRRLSAGDFSTEISSSKTVTSGVYLEQFTLIPMLPASEHELAGTIVLSALAAMVIIAVSLNVGKKQIDAKMEKVYATECKEEDDTESAALPVFIRPSLMALWSKVGMFDEAHSWKQAVGMALLEEHSIGKLFACSGLSYDNAKQWLLAGGKLLTILFVNSVVAHLVYGDDSRCADHDTGDACAAAESSSPIMLSHCEWHAVNETCLYHAPKLTVELILILASVVVGFASLYNIIFAWMMDVSNAPLVIKESPPPVASLFFDDKFRQGFNEFRQLESTRTLFWKAARITKAMILMDTASLEDEVDALVYSLKAKVQQTMHFKVVNFYVLYDSIAMPTKYEKLCRPLKIETISGHVESARKRCSDISYQLQFLSSAADQERYLMMKFLIEMAPASHRVVLSHFLLKHFHLPSRSAWQQFVQANHRTVTLLAGGLVVIHFVLFLFFTFQFTLELVKANIALWSASLIVAVIECWSVEGLGIVVRSVLIKQGIAGKRAFAVLQHLAHRARLIWIRSAGSVVHAASLVQHFNAACRAARSFSQLHIARLLMSVNDEDIKILEPRSTWRWLKHAMLVAFEDCILAVFFGFSYYLGEWFVEVLSASMVLGMVYLCWFLSHAAPIALIALLVVLVGGGLLLDWGWMVFRSFKPVPVASKYAPEAVPPAMDARVRITGAPMLAHNVQHDGDLDHNKLRSRYGGIYPGSFLEDDLTSYGTGMQSGLASRRGPANRRPPPRDHLIGTTIITTMSGAASQASQSKDDGLGFSQPFQLRPQSGTHPLPRPGIWLDGMALDAHNESVEESSYYGDNRSVLSMESMSKGPNRLGRGSTIGSITDQILDERRSIVFESGSGQYHSHRRKKQFYMRQTDADRLHYSESALSGPGAAVLSMEAAAEAVRPVHVTLVDHDNGVPAPVFDILASLDPESMGYRGLDNPMNRAHLHHPGIMRPRGMLAVSRRRRIMQITSRQHGQMSSAASVVSGVSSAAHSRSGMESLTRPGAVWLPRKQRAALGME